MIITEVYTINGKSFTRTYSDTGMVMRNGVAYEEANDPTECGRTYEEVSRPNEEEEDVTPEEVVAELEDLL